MHVQFCLFHLCELFHLADLEKSQLLHILSSRVTGAICCESGSGSTPFVRVAEHSEGKQLGYLRIWKRIDSFCRVEAGNSCSWEPKQLGTVPSPNRLSAFADVTRKFALMYAQPSTTHRHKRTNLR
jgi:hypothetical protein